MTIVPSFLVTGILAIIFGVVVMIWSGFFLKKKLGGLIFILLCIPLLLFGDGLFPPLIGMIAGSLGTRIKQPLSAEESCLSGGPSRFLAVMWPWSLALYGLWVLGQFVIGHSFNDRLLAHGYLIIFMVLGTLVLAVVSAYAHDLCGAAKSACQGWCCAESCTWFIGVGASQSRPAGAGRRGPVQDW
jgi:hypothetical protein